MVFVCDVGVVMKLCSCKFVEVELQKLFVFDINVLMYDLSSFFCFEEYDVYLLMMMFEEFDNYKKGMFEVVCNVCQVSCMFDVFVVDGGLILDGILLLCFGSCEVFGCLYFQMKFVDIVLVEGLFEGKVDNQIFGVVWVLQCDWFDCQVVLVLKDINMWIKVYVFGLFVEDYFNDQVFEDKDFFYIGVCELLQDFWIKYVKGMESWQDMKMGIMYYCVIGLFVVLMFVNEFVYFELQNGELMFYVIVCELNGKMVLLQMLCDYSYYKNNVWGIIVCNCEQNFVLNLLMNFEIDFVMLFGQVGIGKMFVVFVVGFVQVFDDKCYNEIIVMCVIVFVGEDIGFLFGIEEEKMQLWMGVFDDNFEVLQKIDDVVGEWGCVVMQELI